ncbi:hypothetical protein M752DRAFT_65551 [Aspergillus phoenicis ATCC 13157]|uniref:Uncharacterized protein n=1 Tax=Aspergillus phoenicis ATCC 13157 TaxID=1353007 RepID=A0A370PXG4_ASPPH|nr:hypothetical protein M752DRAFT_65551 [Aspergillus phoenicis ATCC 13157]
MLGCEKFATYCRCYLWEYLWAMYGYKCVLLSTTTGEVLAPFSKNYQWVSVSMRAGRSPGLVGSLLIALLLLCNHSPACR